VSPAGTGLAAVIDGNVHACGLPLVTAGTPAECPFYDTVAGS
jgi:hypothetical protein